MKEVVTYHTAHKQKTLCSSSYSYGQPRAPTSSRPPRDPSDDQAVSLASANKHAKANGSRSVMEKNKISLENSNNGRGHPMAL